jgi:hypothetical protein
MRETQIKTKVIHPLTPVTTAITERQTITNTGEYMEKSEVTYTTSGM